MLESKRKAKVRNKLKKEGYFVVQLIKTSPNGMPDTMALKGGKLMFIEMKQPHGIVSPLQRVTHKMLKDQGFEVKIWTDYNIDYE
jgi:Holliday junction resolvase-like predicted endonuclease